MRCSYCRDKNFPFHHAKCLWDFHGLPKEWIHQLKYHQGEHLIIDLEKFFVNSPEWREYLADALLVPIPLHWRRYWQRDYNQSQLIAKAMAKASDAQVIPLLRRCKHSPSQTTLKLHERFWNVQGVFTLGREAKRIDRNRRIILIDDVLTTGATLSSCASVLQEGGFGNIDVATLAHG
jgi:ComF family protein